MLYNKDNPQWFFSEEQHISSEESSRIIRESKQLVTKILKTDVRDFGANIYGVKNDSEDSGFMCCLKDLSDIFPIYRQHCQKLV